MPGFLLTVASTVLCTHGAQAKPMTTDPRVKADHQPIVTQPTPYTVAPCSFVPPVGNGPCVIAQWRVGALRVRASGMPVLLQDSVAVCTPTGTPLNVVLTQVRVKGT